MREFSVTETGLSAEEAEKRLAEHGKNKLKEGKKKSVFLKFFEQLVKPMTLILIVAALISGVLSIVNKEFPSDVLIIVAVVVINAVLGVVQESKAESAIEALNEIAASTSKVIRGGKQIVVHSEDVVPGDIVVLEAGDAVPADGRIVECASIKLAEAALPRE